MWFYYVAWMSMEKKPSIIYDESAVFFTRFINIDAWSTIWIPRCRFHVPWSVMFSKLFIQNFNFGKLSKGWPNIQRYIVPLNLTLVCARRFRLIPASTYLREFASDRSHMVIDSSIFFCSIFNLLLTRYAWTAPRWRVHSPAPSICTDLNTG